MKRLILTFLLFVGLFYALEWVDLAILMVSVGIGMAGMVFVHIFTSPDSVA